MNFDNYKRRGNEEGYLSVGKGSLDPESFEPIKNTDSIKPLGGLWATKHNLNSVCYNDWVNYLTENPAIFYHKYMGCDIPSVFFALKEDANILNINCKTMLNIAKHIHHTEDGQLDFEKLAEVYDGVYIDVRGLHKDGMHEYEDLYCVNTLILFNLNCIDYYKQALVHFEIQDEFNSETYDYNILAKRTRIVPEKENKLTRKRR